MTTSRSWLKRRAGIALFSMLAGSVAVAAIENDPAIASPPAACATSSTAPTHNSGDSTFEISTPEQLIYLSQNYGLATGVSGVTGNWFEQDFVLTANIDLGGCNFSPIGDSMDGFRGTFDGMGHRIEGLVSQGTGRQGMFDTMFYAEVSRLKLVDVDISSTSNSAGGLAASIVQSIVSQVSVTGRVVSSSFRAGGIAAAIQNSDGSSGIFYSKSDATVSGAGSSSSGGGIAAFITVGAKTSNSYARGSVNGVGKAGGFFGSISSGASVTNSYSTGAVTGTGSPLGGFSAFTEGTAPTVTGAFWDTESSGLSTSDKGTGKTTSQMTSFATFEDEGWVIVEGWREFDPPTAVWGICTGVNDGYPFLLWEFDADPCPAAETSPPASTPRKLERADTAAIHLDSMISLGQPVDGHRVLVEGQGLASGMLFQLVLKPQGKVVASGQASGQGYFSENPSLPSGLADGSYTLTLSTFAPDGSPLVLESPFAVSAGRFAAVTAAQPRSPERSTAENQSPTDGSEVTAPPTDARDSTAPEETDERSTIQELGGNPSAARNDPSNPLPVWPMVWLGLGGIALALATTVWLRRLSSVKSL